VTTWWTDTEKKFTLFTILLFFSFRVLDAPFRFYLNKIGLGLLTSLPNFFIFGLLSIALFKATLTFRLKQTEFWTAVIFICSTISGLIYISDIRQIAFGFYGILPFFFGVISCGVFTNNFERLKPFILGCCLISIVGVFLSLYFTFPWVGFSYERFGVDIEGTREWSTFDISRIAGFSRTSYEAAYTILIFLIMLAALLKHKLLKISLVLISGIAITVTTSKTIILVYLLLIAYLITSAWRRFWIILSSILTVIMIALPISTLFVKYDFGITTDLWMRILLLSFEDRLINGWPDVFKLLSKHGSFLLGRGVGGIGGAQNFFEKTIKNPADNLFLYLYVTFGVGVFFILYFLLKRSISLARSAETPLNLFFYLFFLSVITFGITSNVVEGPLFGFLLGAFVMFRPKVQGKA
jgi:hypothetical protein